ncbi:ABC transporter permease [Blautia sp.]|uniref:ABC transporter permease n=1 Tax=Blautia sp. TaxID=1955243 RepID=UPI00258F5D54|nr:ABC transporter permease [Blautia sp.]
MTKQLFLTCKGEIKKQQKNYYNSWSNFISLLIWPVLIFLSTYYVYLSFDITLLKQYGINSNHDLMIFLVIGALGYNSFFSMVQGAFQILNERENGTLEIVYSTPASRMGLLYGRALGGLFQSIWMFSLFFLYIIFFKDSLTIHRLFVIIISYIILIVSSTIWGGFINILFILTRDANYLFTICDEPMNFFSGTKIPTLAFPMWAKIISAIFPLTYCLSIMRNLIMTTNLDSILTALYKLSFSLCTIIIITYLLSVYSEKRNRKTGNLQLY